MMFAKDSSLSFDFLSLELRTVCINHMLFTETTFSEANDKFTSNIRLLEKVVLSTEKSICSTEIQKIF